jgi:hypothetical protein
MKKEIDAAGNFLMGDSNAVSGMITPGTMAFSAEQGLEHVAENRPLIVTVRSALREEGWKVSGNALARGAKFLGKAAIVAHVAFAAADGSEDYNACMAN